jgi:hypothetical protein
VGARTESAVNSNPALRAERSRRTCWIQLSPRFRRSTFVGVDIEDEDAEAAGDVGDGERETDVAHPDDANHRGTVVEARSECARVEVGAGVHVGPTFPLSCSVLECAAGSERQPPSSRTECNRPMALPATMAVEK